MNKSDIYWQTYQNIEQEVKEVAQVIAYCDENKISFKQHLSEIGINP